MKSGIKIAILAVAFAAVGQTLVNANAQTTRLGAYKDLALETKLGELIDLKNEYEVRGQVLLAAEALELVNTLEQIKISIITNQSAAASGGAGGI